MVHYIGTACCVTQRAACASPVYTQRYAPLHIWLMHSCASSATAEGLQGKLASSMLTLFAAEPVALRHHPVLPVSSCHGHTVRRR
jgi:hypothetical protein